MYNLVMDIEEDGNVYGIHASFETEDAAKSRVEREVRNEKSKLISAVLEDPKTGKKTRLA